jgi:hypothetical protein
MYAEDAVTSTPQLADDSSVAGAWASATGTHVVRLMSATKTAMHVLLIYAH